MNEQTEKTMTNMTDETRDEIVRLARKGWSVGQIHDELMIAANLADETRNRVTAEQVQAVIDEADRQSQAAMCKNPVQGRGCVPAATGDDERVYNELYCHADHVSEVEQAIAALANQHPEWKLDMSFGSGNWEEADRG